MKKIYVSLLVLLLCLGFSPLFAQQDIYLKADDLTKDGSTINKFKDYVQLSSVQYGISNPAPTGAGTGAGAGKPNFSEITVSKTVDLSSTKLMLNLTRDTVIQNLEIIFTKNSGGNQGVTLYKIELFNAFVTSFSFSSIPDCSGGCPGAESLSFAYQKIKVTTYTQSPDGRVAPNPVVFSWDLKANKTF